MKNINEFINEQSNMPDKLPEVQLNEAWYDRNWVDVDEHYDTVGKDYHGKYDISGTFYIKFKGDWEHIEFDNVRLSGGSHGERKYADLLDIEFCKGDKMYYWFVTDKSSLGVEQAIHEMFKDDVEIFKDAATSKIDVDFDKDADNYVKEATKLLKDIEAKTHSRTRQEMMQYKLLDRLRGAYEEKYKGGNYKVDTKDLLAALSDEYDRDNADTSFKKSLCTKLRPLVYWAEDYQKKYNKSVDLDKDFSEYYISNHNDLETGNHQQEWLGLYWLLAHQCGLRSFTCKTSWAYSYPTEVTFSVPNNDKTKELIEKWNKAFGDPYDMKVSTRRRGEILMLTYNTKDYKKY